jgi:tubulin delta
MSTVLNWSVWPYLQGEVVLQNYNVLLTLSELIQTSDGVVTLFNDQILKICQNLLGQKRPSYQVLNSVIAQQMASVMYPQADSEASRQHLWQSYNPLQTIAEALCTQD